MKIDSCLIIKNEEENIEKLLNQLLIFSHEIHITDTGSTDNTLNILKKLQNNNSNLYIHYYEWDKDFGKARDYSMNCYDINADYQFWCDGDDLLNDKLIDTLSDFSKNNFLQDDVYYIKYKYWYTDENPHIRASLVKVAANIKWTDPIHEYLNINFKENSLNFSYFNNGSLILHQHNYDSLNHCDRNLDIFFNMEKNNHEFNTRNKYYYACELMNTDLKGLALLKFKEILDADNLDIYAIYAASELITNYSGDPCIYDYIMKLLKYGIFRKDFFYYLGNYHFDKGQEYIAKIYYLACINYPDPDDFVGFKYNDSCIYNSLLQLGLIEYNLGNNQESLKYNEKILELYPGDDIAINNIDILSTLI